jgi:hypothetical protein
MRLPTNTTMLTPRQNDTTTIAATRLGRARRESGDVVVLTAAVAIMPPSATSMAWDASRIPEAVVPRLPAPGR